MNPINIYEVIESRQSLIKAASSESFPSATVCRRCSKINCATVFSFVLLWNYEETRLLRPEPEGD